MKIAFHARMEKISVTDLFFKALQKSLNDLRTLSVYKLQKIASQHGASELSKQLNDANLMLMSSESGTLRTIKRLMHEKELSKNVTRALLRFIEVTDT